MVHDSARGFVAGYVIVVESILLAARVEALGACMGISLVVERGFMNVS